MTQANGLHHIAISTADMKGQIEFFSDVLGMQLQGLFWMHGVEGAWHAFLKLGDACVSLVFMPANVDAETTIGVTHAGSGAGACAPGSMQHIAFNVDSVEALLTMRDRIRSRGVPAFGPIQHGLCTSIYFAGPENLSLELATSHEVPHPLDGKGTWIDKEVTELAGIDAAELDRYMHPAPNTPHDQPLAQPAYSADVPHMSYPEKVYEAMLATPDVVITNAGSVIDPPGLHR